MSVVGEVPFEIGDTVRIKVGVFRKLSREGVVKSIDYGLQYGPMVEVLLEGDSVPVRLRANYIEGVVRTARLEDKSPELHRAEMIDSYMLSIAKCGGSAAAFIDKIDEMTVKEMIDVLAQNGVRFTTVKK